MNSLSSSFFLYPLRLKISATAFFQRLIQIVSSLDSNLSQKKKIKNIIVLSCLELHWKHCNFHNIPQHKVKVSIRNGSLLKFQQHKTHYTFEFYVIGYLCSQNVTQEQVFQAHNIEVSIRDQNFHKLEQQKMLLIF